MYEAKADDWIIDRGRDLGRVGPGLSEAEWFERFTDALPPGGAVLDVGCGSGWPVAAALLAKRFRVTGIDSSPGLLAHATRTLPHGEWLPGDMRTFDLRRRFDGLLGWNSLFHLTPNDQRSALLRILSHAAETCVIMFSTGVAEREAIGEWRGEPLYHGSLDPEEYRTLLACHGFIVDTLDDREQSNDRRVWLARRDPSRREKS